MVRPRYSTIVVGATVFSLARGTFKRSHTLKKLSNKTWQSIVPAEPVQRLGENALCAKSDIKSAFRLLPIYPGSFDLLGIQLNGNFYIDKMLFIF
jgi:hypothetical protein